MSNGEQRWTVPPGISKKRADRLLSEAFSAYSRADFQRAFEQGLVLCRGQALSKSSKLSEGDVVLFRMPSVEPLGMEPVDLQLAVVFEDEHLIAIDKPTGLVVHPGAGPREPTLVHGLLHHCRGQLSGIGGVERPGIVHRLDRETSGLIVAAKTDVAHRGLSELFKSRELVKRYAALVGGCPRLESGRIDKPIERHPVHRHKMRVAPEGEGRRALTDWRLEKGGKRFSLLDFRIHTGRTHQIRIHCQHLGHPILGDTAYGYRMQAELPRQPVRVMLHSRLLAFAHPVTGALLELASELPGDFEPFLEQLEEER